MTISSNTRGNKYHDWHGRFCAADIEHAQRIAGSERDVLLESLDKGKEPVQLFEVLPDWRDPSSPNYDPKRVKAYEKALKMERKRLKVDKLSKMVDKMLCTKATGGEKPAVVYKAETIHDSSTKPKKKSSGKKKSSVKKKGGSKSDKPVVKYELAPKR